MELVTDPPEEDPPPLSSTELAVLAGVTYRQVDYWARANFLRTVGWDGERNPRLGHGVPRYHPASELPVAVMVNRLLEAGFRLTPQLFKVARKLTLCRVVPLGGDFCLVDTPYQ